MQDSQKCDLMLVLEASQSDCDRIQDLFESGKLSELLGFTVYDVKLDVGAVPENKMRVELSRWRQNLIDPIWKTFQDLEGMVEDELEWEFVRSESTMAELLRSLHSSQDEARIWMAALALGKVDAGHPEAGMAKVRSVDLGELMPGRTVMQTVRYRQKPDGDVSVLIGVCTPHGQAYLPEGIELMVLDSEDGEVIEKKQAGSQDKAIAIQVGGEPGDGFSSIIALGDFQDVVDFVI